jgi:hypothetical protein
MFDALIYGCITTIKVTCAALELAASAPQTFTASSEPPGSAFFTFDTLMTEYKTTSILINFFD